ncbi:hypothetical protein ES708_00735 [subsurface metagenome]
MKRYMEMIYIDDKGDARLTGIGAMFETDDETTVAFESIRAKELDIKNPKAKFIVDLWEKNGSIVDSIAIDVPTFESVSGEKFQGNQHYVDYDVKKNAELRA